MERKLKAVLKRVKYQDKQTLGELVLFEDDKEIFRCKTLERPWDNNKKGHSCIPVGTYPVIYRHSPKFKNQVLPWLQNTAPREYILIHAGNYYTNIEGCILVGKAHADINGDGYLDVTSSVVTLAELKKVLLKKDPKVMDLPEVQRYQDFELEII